MKQLSLLFLCLGLVFSGDAGSQKREGLLITSPAFKSGQRIPDKFTCHGEEMSPALVWSEVPKEAKSLAVTFEDLSAGSRIIVHWVVYNIPPETKGLPQNVPKGARLASGAQQAYNWSSFLGYMGPCPGNQRHQYVFRLFALDAKIEEEPPLNAGKVILFIENHTLAKAELVGYYR